jgi:glycosyltransferase involved in cell wall biosynthesis
VTPDKLNIPQTTFPTEIVRPETDDQLAELYSQSDIFASPSWYEGFPLPPLEAMSCGTPVVTTRIGAEDYAADGENALIVEPRKPEQMAAEILRILNDPNLRDKLVSNGIETAKKLTWDETANKVEAALFRMANGK